MKNLLCAALLLIFSLSVSGVQFDRGIRQIRVSGKSDAVKKVEIVIPKKTPMLNFAAKELQSFLKKSSQVTSVVVSNPTPGAYALILGDNEYSRKAGLDVKKLASEGFFIKRQGKQIFLAGVDDPAADPAKNRWKMWMKRGTLSAVYDFLERFAGVRFYFPGELGTIVPQNKALMLPEKIDIIDRPDLINRDNYSGHKSKWYEKNDIYLGTLKGYNLSFLRQRNTDRPMPFGHGLAYLDLIKRFGSSHPEYFALTPDNRRYKEADMTHPGHICYHSGIMEEIYKDAKTYLTGGTASSRGLKSWSVNFGSKPYISIMPQDWLYWCCCAKCAKIAPGARVYQNDPKAAQAISNFLWKHTSDFARRLKKDKLNAVVTQMAYGCLDRLPECDIPDNVAIQLAVKGMGKPEYWGDDIELLKKWYKKTGGKISIWTYPGKHMSKAEMKGIPAMMHRQTALYLQHVKKYIYGVFLESETDFEIFNYLNYYTFAKVAWDLDTDLDKLLDEHYRLMFGAGASEMKKFFNELEELWCKKIIGNIVDTPLGPMVKLPNDFEVWSKIYSPAKLKELDNYITRARSAAAKDPLAVKRLEFMRREMLGPIKNAAAVFAKSKELMGSWNFHLPGKVGLRPYKGEVCDVTTSLEAKEDAENFIFTFECEEPLMKHILAKCKGFDNKETFADSCVEILLNPSGDRKNYFHIIVNTNGAVTDALWKRMGKGNYKWNSNSKVEVVKRADGFTIKVVLPKKSIGKYDPEGFPVNFARHRAIKGAEANKVNEIYYQWSPAAGRSFHATERWGVMKFGAPANRNLLKDGDFEVTKIRLPYYVGAWGLWSSEGYKVKRAEVDKKVFMTGNASLHLMNKMDKRVSAGQKFKGMKPNTLYRFSFLMKTKGITGRIGAGAYLTIGKKHYACPNVRVVGDTSWHRRSFDIRTTEDITPDTQGIVGLWIWSAQGDVWYDDVSIREVK